MFTNFNNIFKNNNSNEIPKEIMNIINNELPKEFKYQEIGNGVCGIVPINGNLLHMKSEIKLPDIPTQIKQQIHTFEDLYDYLYRSQKCCEVMPDNDGNVEINGIKFPLNNIVKDVRNNISYMKVQIVPQAFPPPVLLDVKVGEIIKKFTFSRQPIDSLDKIYIKSIEEKPICIEMYINNKIDNNSNVNVSFKININIDEIENVHEIVDVCEFYNNFMTGDIEFHDAKIKNIKFNELPDNLFLDEKIDFWKKVLKLEEYFNIKFNASKINDTDDYEMVIRLYKSLIEGKSFKLPNKVKTMTFESNESLDNVKNKMGNKVLIDYIQDVNYELMGQNLHLFYYDKIENANISNIIEEGGKYKIIFDDSEENNNSIIRQIYIDKNKLDVERKK